MRSPAARLAAAAVVFVVTIAVMLTAAARAVGESIDPGSCMELVTTSGAILRCPPPPPETAPVAVAVVAELPTYTG